MNVSLASDLKDESMMLAEANTADGYNADASRLGAASYRGEADSEAEEGGCDHDDDDKPVPRAPASVLDDDDMPRTPTLEDWKLSHVTRHIIDQRKPVKTVKTPLGQGGDVTGASVSQSFGGSPIENAMSPVVVESPAKSSRAMAYSTPIEYSGRPFEMARYSSSPDTPTLGTPTKTCSIMVTSAAVNMALVSPKPDTRAQAEHDAEAPSGVAGLNVSVTSEDGLPDPLVSSSVLRSPPKAVKVLNPRRAVPLAPDGKPSAASANSDNGWIPLVSEEEWSKAPSFLKLQFGLSAMNKMLTLLNQFIAENMKTSSKHLESFSYEEIVRIVQSAIDPSPIKVVVLGLVHLKRLDVGTENSIKVYKIRRFYH
jgi:hypothetical protein